MKKTFIVIALACTLLTACENYGEKLEVSSSEVYFKDGASEPEAKKLGEFLKKQGYFDSSKKATVQLVKDKDDYVVKMVVDEKEINKDKAFYQRYFWFVQDLISKEVFNGKKTKIVMADKGLKEIESVGAIAKANINPKNSVYYNPENITAADVQKLGDNLTKLGYFNGSKDLDVFLDKEKGENHLRFIVDEAAVAANKEEIMPFFKASKYVIEKNVFNNQKAKVLLTSLELKDIEEVKELSAAEKAAIDAELSAP